MEEIKSLKWGQSWKNVILRHVQDMIEVIPFELAKEFRGIHSDKIAYILRTNGWKKHLPPARCAKRRIMRHVKYTQS